MSGFDPVSAAIAVGLSAVQMGIAMSQRIEGQRVGDVRVTLSEFGTPIPDFHGTMIFDGPPLFFAEDIEIVEHSTKTKGGKLSEDLAFGTFAAMIARHEVSSLLQVKMDRHLVYDATAAGPVTLFPLSYTTRANKGKGTATTVVDISDHMRFYTGSASQMPDPRMQASVEARHGAGSCPAYRGRAYVMFERIPLQGFGNRIPQLGFRVSRETVEAFPYETFDAAVNGHDLENAIISPDGERLLWANGTHYDLWDLPSRTRLNGGVLPVAIYSNPLAGNIAFKRDGTVLALASPNGHDLIVYSPDMASALVLDEYAGTQQLDLFILEDGDGDEHVLTTPIPAGGGAFTVDGISYTMSALTGVNWYPSFFFADGHGDIWACGSRPGTFGSFTDAFLYRIVRTSGIDRDTDFLTIGGLPAAGGYTDVFGAHYMDDTHDQIVLFWQGNFSAPTMLIDIETGAVIDSGTPFGWTQSLSRMFKNVRPGDATMWVGGISSASEISLADLSTVRSLDLTDWKTEDVGGVVWSRKLNALIGWPQFSDVMTIRYLDRLAPAQTTWRDVVEDVCAQADIASEHFDASALTTPCRGFKWSLAAGKEIIAPPLDMLDATARPHGFGLQFINRGGAAGATIGEGELADPGIEAAPWQEPRNAGGDVPRGIPMRFLDADADLAYNVTRDSRSPEVTNARAETMIDMGTTVLTAAEARDYVARLNRRRAFARMHKGFALTTQHLALEPGDVRPILLGGVSQTAFAVSLRVEANRTIAVDWERDDPAVHDLAGLDGGAMDGRDPDRILVAAPSRAAILDIPLMEDAHETRVPFLYFGAGPYSPDADNLGSQIWMSDTGQFDDYAPQWAMVPASNAMSWGTATNALGESLPWLWDRGSVLNVNFRFGEPAGATEAEILADATLNLAAYGTHERGWELVQFTTPELQGDGTHNISGLRRGVRGTEHLIAGHEVGDMFILLATAQARKTMGIGELGDEDFYRAVANGRQLEGAFEQPVTFIAAANKPYAPVHGALHRNGSTEDWTVDAARRSRIGGGNVYGASVPLGETAESWKWEILDGSDVVRTITGSSLPLVYTAAQQVADFGSAQTSLSTRMMQVAPDLSLDGYPLSLAA